MHALDPEEELTHNFGSGGETWVISAPGRVNLIGEHIDYHGLPVLPMAMRRSIRVAFRARMDRRIRAVSAKNYGVREFEWTPGLAPTAPGDWENYLRAAAQAVGRRWGIGVGVDAAVVSDLPPAAGLSSSSALIVAFALGLLRANRIDASFAQLMEILPEGEHFTGTRGGGMDHAASLASRAGCASLIEFEPLSVRPIPIPKEWGFVVAHCLQTAEKSGDAREEYNSRRAAGTDALRTLGFDSYRAAIKGRTYTELAGLGEAKLLFHVKQSFLHVISEALRVEEAVIAILRNEPNSFGRLLLASHASLRDRLKVSSPALDQLVAAATESGALGARLTGAGFGGCVVAFGRKDNIPALREGLIARYYSGHAEFAEDQHLITAEPGPGALYPEKA